MGRLIFVGLFTEGTTDIRFLESIVKKTLDDIAFDCKGQVETEVLTIKINKKKLGFVDQVSTASKTSMMDYGISILCVHTDADNNLPRIIETKVNPAIQNIETSPESTYCKTIVFIIPVQMVESWMLADKNLFKSEINTNYSDNELGIANNPEDLTNPKLTIENAIRITKANSIKRKRGKGISIADLYQIIGQKLEIQHLEALPSFVTFKQGLKAAFQKLNYL
jgi:hypothetical protein